MVSDDERREVAERLRKAEVYTLVGKRNDGLTLEWSVALMSELAEAAGLEDAVGIEVFARLADLIDPGDTSLSGRDTVACDREALLAEAKEAEKNAWYFVLDHDEDELRDRLTEAAEEFSDVARRIREACGEVVE